MEKKVNKVRIGAIDELQQSTRKQPWIRINLIKQVKEFDNSNGAVRNYKYCNWDEELKCIL